MDRIPDACVVGLGHVGLPTAVLLARAGRRVVGVDTDPARIDAIRSGHIGPEPGLAAALAEVGNTLTLAARPVPSPAYVVCVPTPRERPLDAVDAAVASVAAVAPPGALVVIESTVPVGTTDALASRHETLAFVACPERVLPGDALAEIVGNDRIVGGSPKATEAACALLSSFVAGELIRTDARTAELVKLVENTARDVELALTHTVAELARTHGLDAHEVRRLANRHPRVDLLVPGIGVGGHCLPVDPWFLADAAPLARTAREVNEAVPERIVAWLRPFLPAGASIGLLGLAYKPDVADARNAPAVDIARALSSEYDVVVTDPDVPIPDDLTGVSLPEALKCDVVVLLVAHMAYRGVRERIVGLAIDACGGWR